MRRIAQDDGFSLMPGKNCQRMTEHLQSRRGPRGSCSRRGRTNGEAEKKDSGFLCLQK